MTTATVYLVGAGPGDSGLITLRGASCLYRADLVLYDYLVNPRILVHAPASAETVCLGRHGKGHGRILSVDEVTTRMIDAARQGKSVVRLKAGDPVVFARAAEELDGLRRAGVPYVVVPGVTAALAVGSYAGVPLTDRDAASCVAFVTGQRQPENGEDLDYAALGHFPGTLVFYMGVTTVDRWSRELIAGGKSADTPVVVVRRCSYFDQQIHTCRLDEVANWVATNELRPPALFVVGDVAQHATLNTWFTERPLFGKRILVTRPIEKAGSTAEAGQLSGGGGSHDSLTGLLLENGADVVFQPAIKIAPPADWTPVDRAIEQLDQHDWLVFLSANGVRYFLQRLTYRGRDLRALGGLALAAIGPATADALDAASLRADVVPTTYRSESLAAALAPKAGGKRFLIARANRGSGVLTEQLSAAGGIVEEVAVYDSQDVQIADQDVAAALAAGTIAWTTVTSSAIAQSLVGLFGESLRKTKLAAISPITASALEKLGHPATIVADRMNGEGIVEAILRAEGSPATGNRE